MLNLNKGKLIGFSIKNGTKKISKKIHFEFPEETSRVRETEEEVSSEEEEVNIDYPPKRKRKKLLEERLEMICCDEGEHMEPYYDPKERITMFIAGTQGCGKSYFVSEFLHDYKLAHPDRPIYLFTGLEEKDAHFSKHEMRKVTMKTEVIENITLERLRYADKKKKMKTGCLLIFDDTDRIRDEKLKKVVYGLMHDALCNGRDHATQKAYADIDVVVTNHEINDYLNTKYILTECNYVVLFPFFTVGEQIEKILKKIAVSKKAVEEIIGYKGRSVIIHKVAPIYCITKSKIFLLR